jgi:hypothetical protein
MTSGRGTRADKIKALVSAAVLLLFIAAVANAQTAAFSYQGKLTDSGNPANGQFDFQFKLFDTVTVGTGTQQGVILVRNPVAVSAGIFTVTLDFGANVFIGADRFLEIGVRPAGNLGLYTILSPRQQITSSPYAIQTVNSQLLGGLPASRYVAADVSGNVGIGLLTPSYKLHVVDTGSAGLRVQTNTSGGKVASFGGFGDFLIDANNFVGGRLTVQQGGNIGIGTADPQARLDVRGDVKLGTSGQLFAMGGEENLRIVRGTVDLNGNILAGSGFQVFHSDTGEYFISFNTPFADVPSITMTIDGNGARWSIFTQTWVTDRFGFNISTYEPGQTGAFHSFGFNFIAVGTR